MRILKHGTIELLPDGARLVKDFEISCDGEAVDLDRLDRLLRRLPAWRNAKPPPPMEPRP